jgi:hypothetical protein
MNCQQWRTQWQDFLDERMPAETARKAQQHLDECADCARDFLRHVEGASAQSAWSGPLEKLRNYDGVAGGRAGTQVKSTGNISKLRRFIVKHAWGISISTAATAVLMLGIVFSVKTPVVNAVEETLASLEKGPLGVKTLRYIERDIEAGADTTVEEGSKEIIFSSGMSASSKEIIYTREGVVFSKSVGEDKAITSVEYADSKVGWNWVSKKILNPQKYGPNDRLFLNPANVGNSGVPTPFDGAAYAAHFRKIYEFKDGGEEVIDGHACHVLICGDFSAEKKAQGYVNLLEKTLIAVDKKLAVVRRESLVFKNGRVSETRLVGVNEEFEPRLFDKEAYMTTETVVEDCVPSIVKVARESKNQKEFVDGLPAHVREKVREALKKETKR